MAKAIRSQRVGRYTVRVTSGRNEMIGIGDRWDAEVEGKVTVMIDTPHGLFVGTSDGAVSRLETVTGRRLAHATLSSPITSLAVDGTSITVTAGEYVTQLLARSLKPKR